MLQQTSARIIIIGFTDRRIMCTHAATTKKMNNDAPLSQTLPPTHQ
jgi:hypothetical protein